VVSECWTRYFQSDFDAAFLCICVPSEMDPKWMWICLSILIVKGLLENGLDVLIRDCEPKRKVVQRGTKNV
jgi:hypothetical protein